MHPVRETQAMIAGMRPILRPGTWVFVRCPPAQAARLLPRALAMMREDEGLSLILPLEVARVAGFDVALPMGCVTLQVPSALDGIGLTAAVAGTLADHGIACNMVAAYGHDHAFVPRAEAERALALLKARAALAGRADADTKTGAIETDAP